jgi:hypothetical protein
MVQYKQVKKKMQEIDMQQGVCKKSLGLPAVVDNEWIEFEAIKELGVSKSKQCNGSGDANDDICRIQKIVHSYLVNLL